MDKIKKMSEHTFKALCALPTLHVSDRDSKELLKAEQYVDVQGKMYLERVWVYLDSANSVLGSVTVERRRCPNGSWEDHVVYYVSG